MTNFLGPSRPASDKAGCLEKGTLSILPPKLLNHNVYTVSFFLPEDVNVDVFVAQSS